MNYGFVKVAAAVPHVKVADCKFNVEKIESLIAVAEGKGVQIILFPEMSITGYTCGDLFSQQLLLEEAEMAKASRSTRDAESLTVQPVMELFSVTRQWRLSAVEMWHWKMPCIWQPDVKKCI